MRWVLIRMLNKELVTGLLIGMLSQELGTGYLFEYRARN